MDCRRLLATLLLAACSGGSPVPIFMPGGDDDMAPVDMAAPDLEPPRDLSVHDLVTPDLVVRDLATPDLATPDLSLSTISVDLMPFEDLAPSPDLTTFPDLVPPPDLTVLCSDGRPAPCGTTVFLAHFDGSDGSTTFIDEAPIRMTGFNQAHITTAQSRFGGASLSLDGASNVQSDYDGALDLSGPTPFTLEVWVDGSGTIVSSDSYGVLLVVDGGGALHLWLAGVITPWDDTGAVVGNVPSGWHHVALTYDGAQYRVFVDGKMSYARGGQITGQTNKYLQIGQYMIGAQPNWKGFLDELRIVKGSARYTSDFTPPTAPFTYP